jgi:hypothetical protein
MVWVLFTFDSLTALVLAYRFVRLLCDEEVNCRFVVETPTFAEVCGAKMDAIMHKVGQFLVDSFFADDSAVLTTVIKTLDRVLMRAAKNGWVKRQWIPQFLQNIVPQLKEKAEATGEPISTMIQRLHHDYQALLDEFDEGFSVGWIFVINPRMLMFIAMNQETQFFTPECLFQNDLPHMLIRMTLDSQPVRVFVQNVICFLKSLFQGYRQPIDEQCSFF